MSTAREKAIARAVLDRYGRTFAEELHLNVARGTPAVLFGLLCASLMMSARIRYRIALDATQALLRRWSTAEKLAGSTWQQRVDVIHAAGYARYDERTSTMLGETAERLLDRYGGDLRRLREEAGRDPRAERRLLTEFKGIGDVGADIFLREVQVAWDELWPFADRRARDVAGRLGLPRDAAALAELTSRRDFPRLVTGLVRVGLEKDHDAVRDAART